MATRRGVRNLMVLYGGFEWMRLSCSQVAVNNHKIPVDGIGFFINVFERSSPVTKALSKTFASLATLHSFNLEWIKYFKKNYNIKNRSKNSEYITIDDAKKLRVECEEWLKKIEQCYSTDGTVFLTDKLLADLIPRKLYLKLSKFEKEDLADGVLTLQTLLPTPAVMILLRVAENILQKYYKKITNKNVGKKTWGQIIEELENTGKVPKSVLGHLYFMNDKRIDSAHPYKRYTQEEGERVLLNLKDLMESIYLPRKRK